MISLLRMTKQIAAFVLLLFFINTAFALEAKTYEELKKTSREVLKIHINGVGEGYSWSNSILAKRGDKVFYCPPPKVALNAENYIDIIDAQVSKMKSSGMVEIPVELILFFGLVDSFPCSK